MSACTLGSAFSLMVRPAVVCAAKMWQTPSFTPLCRTSSWIWPVMSTISVRWLVRTLKVWIMLTSG